MRLKADVKLIFNNAMLYNPEGSIVHNMAKETLILSLPRYRQMKRIGVRVETHMHCVATRNFQRRRKRIFAV